MQRLYEQPPRTIEVIQSGRGEFCVAKSEEVIPAPKALTERAIMNLRSPRLMKIRRRFQRTVIAQIPPPL